MLLYYLLVITVFLFTIFDFVKSESVKLIAYIFLCALLVAFVGLRSLGIDNDGIAYEDAFNMASGMSWMDLIRGDYEESMERAYLLLNKLVYHLGGNIHVVFILMAMVTGLVNYTLIYRKSPYPFCSLLVYVCFFYFYRDFTQIRYALSAGLGLWAIFMFIDRQYVHSAVLITCAAFIHSAVLIVPILYLFFAVGKKYLFYFFLPVLGAIGSVYDPVMYLFGIGGLPPTLANYVEQDEFGRGGYMLSAVVQVFMLAILIYKDKLIEHYDKRVISIFFIALSIGSFINLLFISFSIMQRLASQLFVVIIFVVPYFFWCFESKGRDQYVWLIFRFLFMIFVLYYGLNMIDIGLMRPYRIL